MEPHRYLIYGTALNQGERSKCDQDRVVNIGSNKEEVDTEEEEMEMKVLY